MKTQVDNTDSLRAEFPDEWDTLKIIEFLIDGEVDSYASNEYDSYHPTIKTDLMPKIKALILQDRDRVQIEARIDELSDLNTRRHYGLDYQASLDALDDYKDERMATLKAQLSSQSIEEQEKQL